MFERYTERARRVIFFARYEAVTNRDATIGPEHLLLGLMRENKALLAAVAGPEPGNTLTDELMAVFSQQPKREAPLSTSVDPPLNLSAKIALATAQDESIERQSPHINTTHILLALLRNHVDHPMFDLLRDRGITYETARSKIPNELPEPEQHRSPPTTDFGRYSESARRVIFFGRYEASVWRSKEISAEHLLLALVRADKPLWTTVVGEETRPTLAEQVRAAMPEASGEAQPVSVDLPLSASARAALFSAHHLAAATVETSHLLLGLLQNHLPPAISESLNQRGITFETVRAKV